jgi:hypothetical protein
MSVLAEVYGETPPSFDVDDELDSCCHGELEPGEIKVVESKGCKRSREAVIYSNSNKKHLNYNRKRYKYKRYSGKKLFNSTVIVLKCHNTKNEAYWRNVFKRENYSIYDHNYPFRVAANNILGNRSHISNKTEEYALFLSSHTNRFLGADFASKHFVNWYEKQTAKRIVVCGLWDHDMIRKSEIDITYLKCMGAIIVAEEGEEFSGCNFVMKKRSDVRSITERIERPFHSTMVR